MDWINFFVADIVQHKATGQLLAVSNYINSPCSGYIAVDEDRRDFDFTDQEDGPNVPLEVFFLTKRDVVRIKASKEKAALVAELNAKIVHSNIRAVGYILARIDALADLAEIKRLADMAKKLLTNAEGIDAQVLKRYFLSQPQGVELNAQEQK